MSPEQNTRTTNNCTFNQNVASGKKKYTPGQKHNPRIRMNKYKLHLKYHPRKETYTRTTLKITFSTFI